MQRFYVGMLPGQQLLALERVCVSWGALRARKSDMPVGKWLLDSGAYNEIQKHGEHRDLVETHAAAIKRWAKVGELEAAVAQDYPTDTPSLSKTGKGSREHRRLTIERYDALMAHKPPCIIMPVLQGATTEEIVAHLSDYGARIKSDAWVGVGAIYGRPPNEVDEILHAVLSARPNLRVHGFGVKLRVLASSHVRRQLWSADSFAWSFTMRMQRMYGKNGLDGHQLDVRVAQNFERRIHALMHLPDMQGFFG